MDLSVADALCYCSPPILCLCYLPTSELFDPPTQLSQCSSGPLSTSLQLVHQRPPSLISCAAHSLIGMDDNTFQCIVISLEQKLGQCYQRWSQCQKPRHRARHKIMQSRFRFQWCLSLLAHVQGDFPRSASCLFLLKPGETEICTPSLPLRESVLAASEEMRGKFLFSNARLYAIYDSLHGQILWIDLPLLCDCKSYSFFYICAHTVYCTLTYIIIYMSTLISKKL